MNTEERKIILNRAHLKDISILSIKNLTTIFDEDFNNPLHILARYGIVDILDHPDCTTCCNSQGDTPAHTLARTHNGRKILEYEDILISINADKVTCLEVLAHHGESQILNHHLVDCVFYGKETPRQIYEIYLDQKNKGQLEDICPKCGYDMKEYVIYKRCRNRECGYTITNPSSPYKIHTQKTPFFNKTEVRAPSQHEIDLINIMIENENLKLNFDKLKPKIQNDDEVI